MHSVTKFLGGHGVALGGALVDGGRFDWEASGRFDTMTEPYVGYHGISFADEFGPAAFITRARAEGLRDFGAAMSPANAFQLLQGVETSRCAWRHVENARAVTEMLEANDAVAWVKYPTASDHPDRRSPPSSTRTARAPFSASCEGWPGRRQGVHRERQACDHLANVGDAKTLVLHPASTTHQQLSAEDLEAAGIGEDLIRVSVGIEDVRDIIDDLSTALKISQR